MNPYHDSLIKLVGLSNFLEQQTGLSECLQDLTKLAAGILEVRNCSIMLFHDEQEPGEFRLHLFAKHGPLPSAASGEALKVTEGIAGQVAARGEPVLVRDISQSPYYALARRPHDPSRSFISVPITIAGKVIGIINFSNPLPERRLDAGDLKHAVFVSLLVGKSIQVFEIQKILSSKFLQFSLFQEAEAVVGGAIAPLSRDPEKLAKIVAKTFYREMTGAGFAPDHIVKAATEIISLLNQTLSKHKKRLKTRNSEGEEPHSPTPRQK